MLQISKIISGGQTGADLGGLKAAKKCFLETGGHCPKGFRTEDGSNLDLKNIYNLKETKSSDYPPRTRLNIANSDFTLIFSRTPLKGGSKLTENICKELDKPYFIIDISKEIRNQAIDLYNVLSQESVRILNVAGSRASKEPMVESYVIEFLEYLFLMEGRITT